MRVGLIVHIRREDALAYARRAVDYLAEAGASVIAEDEAAAALGIASFSQADGADVILSLGGDGTLLRGAQYAMRWDAMLLGINLGRVGFLAEVEPDALEDALHCLISGAYTTEVRPILNVQSGGGTWYALNDVVVSRGGYARLITINALVDGESSGRYVADGIVVATPTGSTGYSLSAGGPVISPGVDCMVITPICAHTLQHRPAVVQGGAHIRLQLMPEDEQSASLQVDGQSRAVLTAGMTVDIRKDSHSIRLIRIRQGRFFQLVRDKLTEWTR
ncbi:MAG: NAD(+)/NADH kinase [Clostridia bacterium]|nr:NAD(+)/NADH kinase [Clostridia bacterium]